MFISAVEVSTNYSEIEPRDNGGPDLEFRYHDHDQLTRYLRAVSARYPALTALYSIGKSVQGTLSFTDPFRTAAYRLIFKIQSKSLQPEELGEAKRYKVNFIFSELLFICKTKLVINH